MGFPMRGTVTATGRTCAVAVPPLRREQTGNGQGHKLRPAKERRIPIETGFCLVGQFEQVSNSGPH